LVLVLPWGLLDHYCLAFCRCLAWRHLVRHLF
jgi:hypothetical protein